MLGLVVKQLMALALKLITKKAVEELAILAVKEVVKFTENKVDDEAVNILLKGLGREQSNGQS